MVPLLVRLVTLVLWTIPLVGGRFSSILNPQTPHGLSYFHDTVPEVPWSMHVVKIDRSRASLELHTALGNGTWQGMQTVPEQIRLLPASPARPVAAVNGDLYNSHPDYPGDPEGLQIVRGELVSGPSPERVCFWIDAQGRPNRGDVRAQFRASWAQDRAVPFGLNEARADDAAVLYTAAAGPSTRTRGGVDLVLEPAADDARLPLEVGRSYRTRVTRAHFGGNAPLTVSNLVLSLGPELTNRLARSPTPAPGTEIHLSTATTPPLAGVRTAIGGGPTLVSEGRAREWSGVRLRHPRTAVGWNAQHLFLVVVDGRQLRVSAGMTFPELADYLVRLGCDEAIALDGGGSATCWVRGQVMNSPSQGRERPAANALVVMQTPPTPQPPP